MNEDNMDNSAHDGPVTPQLLKAMGSTVSTNMGMVVCFFFVHALHMALHDFGFLC